MEIDPMGLPIDKWPHIHGYQLLEQMGSGTYGIVFKAMQESLDRFVKIKYFFPLPHVKKTNEALERFAQEAKIIAKLEHPSIEVYHDFKKEHDGSYYIVTEYFDGKSVRKYLKHSGRYNFAEAINIIIKVCTSIRYCHDKGIIHRDLKPAHIIVGNEGMIKLVDFGVAYDFEEKVKLYSTSSGIGTIPYMCPEQFEDPTHRDKRNDIYSIGVILYEMLTGHIPKVAPAHKSVSDIIADTDPRIDKIIEKCLSEESHRYNTMNELLEACRSLEFVQQQKKMQLEEDRQKYLGWAEKMAKQKVYTELQMESVRRKIEMKKKDDDRIWLKGIKQHIEDLKQLVDALNKTKEFNLTDDWEEIKDRPSVHKGSGGPVIGQIKLSENEVLRVRLGFLDSGRYIGNFIQPGIIWETEHSKRGSGQMQERFFVIDSEGSLKIYGKVLLRYSKKKFKIQDAYLDFFERKFQYTASIDETTVQNILFSLCSANYLLRRDQGYELIEDMGAKWGQI